MKYDSVKKEAADLKQKYKNITEYLGIDAEREVSKEQRKVNGRIK